MSIQTTTFQSPAKQAWRSRNIQLVKNLSHLTLNEDLTLKFPWFELLGASGRHSIAQLQSAGMLDAQATNFIGLDRDPNIVRQHKADFPSMVGIAGNFDHKIGELEKRAPGILNIDGLWSIDSSGINQTNIKCLVKKSVRTHGICIMILNCSLDNAWARSVGTSNALKSHTDKFIETFNGYSLGCSIKNIAMTDEQARTIAKRNFEGCVGAYDIYQGEDRASRMFCMRVVFQ